ncbi:MAG: sigma-54 dependent transcriptional regulator [Sedimentisphaerales bacterium]
MSLDRVVTVTRDADVQQLAQEHAREVFGADDPSDALQMAHRINASLILYDYHWDPTGIHDFLRKADKSASGVPVVVVGGNGSSEHLTREFGKVKGYHFLEGRTDRDRLARIIRDIESACGSARSHSVDADRPSPVDAAGDSKSHTEDDASRLQTGLTDCERGEDRFFADELCRSVSMVGKSRAILNMLKMIRLVARSCCNPILIVGETGTGKELAAQAIHTLRHPNEPFVAVNCAALTASLLESELFGHVKGAFTGADRDKTGLLEVAGAGTLLLDEISEMPMDLQAKLLRVLQEKSFRKVGGIKNTPCNATIIASSNRNLGSEVQANRFRRDLYYRLDVSPIVLAPLRSAERREDIRLLAEHFLETSTICPEKRDAVHSLTKLALDALERHDWPGNVRELRNVIERAILLETTSQIGLNAIVINSTECGQASDNPASGLIKGFSLAKAERELIFRALQETGWQKTRAAALLGITRATLYAKVKQYKIGKTSSTTKNSAHGEPSRTLASPTSISAC